MIEKIVSQKKKKQKRDKCFAHLHVAEKHECRHRDPGLVAANAQFLVYLWSKEKPECIIYTEDVAARYQGRNSRHNRVALAWNRDREFDFRFPRKICDLCSRQLNFNNGPSRRGEITFTGLLSD